MRKHRPIFDSDALLIAGLWNATMLLSEKGFYAMSFFLSLFAAIVVQKNTRDSQLDGQSHYSFNSPKPTARFGEEPDDDRVAFTDDLQ